MGDQALDPEPPGTHHVHARRPHLFRRVRYLPDLERHLGLAHHAMVRAAGRDASLELGGAMVCGSEPRLRRRRNHGRHPESLQRSEWRPDDHGAARGFELPAPHRGVPLHLGDDHHLQLVRAAIRLLRDAGAAPRRPGPLACFLDASRRWFVAAGARHHGGAGPRPHHALHHGALEQHGLARLHVGGHQGAEHHDELPHLRGRLAGRSDHLVLRRRGDLPDRNPARPPHADVPAGEPRGRRHLAREPRRQHQVPGRDEDRLHPRLDRAA